MKKMVKNIKKTKYITATDARKDLFNILDMARESPFPTRISKSGQNYILVKEEDYEDMEDLLDMYSDSKFMADFRQGIKEIENGETVSLEELKKEMGW